MADTHHNVVSELATRFPQLYVAPADDAADAYKLAFTRGVEPEDKSLSHFVGTPQDWHRTCETPAGEVEAVFLAERADFENFQRCLMHRCQPVPIPATIGAQTILGLPDWGVIRARRDEILGSGSPSASEEFGAFLADGTNYRIALVLISEGPYSAVEGSAFGIDDATWTRVSRDIRLYHELAHVTCRRLMPDDKPPIWDELTADMNGLVRALGRYEAKVALRLVGIEGGRYVGGRLEEYLSEGQLASIESVAADVTRACEGIERRAAGVDAQDSFDLLLDLKREPLLAY